MRDVVFRIARGILLLPFLPVLWLAGSQRDSLLLSWEGDQTNGEEDVVNEHDRKNYQASLIRLRQSLQEIGGISFLSDIFTGVDRAFGGPEGFVRVVRSWTDLIDILVLEAENEYGSSRGKGPAKKRTVKGAILYFASRTSSGLPSVQAPFVPFVLDILFDPVVDALVAMSNRYQLWGEVRRKPGFGQRIRLSTRGLGSFFAQLMRSLARLSWRLVLFSSPSSPRLTRAVNEFLKNDPSPQKNLAIFVTWAVQHTGTISILLNMFAEFEMEAQLFAGASPEQQKAYARGLIFAFLDETVEMPERGTLAYQLLSSAIELGLELTSMLLTKRTAALSPSRLGPNPP